ncbi:MAG: thioredoxin fold domain-containing protein, partial [Sterolibacterium sp.]
MPASSHRTLAKMAACLTLLLPLTAWPATAAAAASASAKTPTDHAIDWQKGSVDSVFAAARAGNKPLFLYWGARWCPPCNQVKATIFNRQDFIEKSRFFLPVYIDGDSPGAQKLGARFKVRGYPTMILFKPSGEEITRLPGEVDAERYMQVLSIGINATRPIKELLQSALADAPALSNDDWRLLAYYSWDTDEQQLLSAKGLAATLKRLAVASRPTAEDISARFALRALVAEATAKGSMTSPEDGAIGQVLTLLGNPKLARDNFDLIANYSGDLLAYLASPNPDQQRQLGSAWNAALDRFMEDGSLSTADRLTAMAGKVAAAKREHAPGALPQAI